MQCGCTLDVVQGDRDVPIDVTGFVV